MDPKTHERTPPRPDRGRPPLFQTTPELDEGVESFCLSIGATMPLKVEVAPAADAEPGRCCFNAIRQVARHGGCVQYGWTIRKCPLFLTAEFHAVWRTADGAAIDVTPNEDGETTIAFAPDPRYPGTFDFMRRPENRTRRIFTGAASRADQVIAGLPALRRAYEEERAAAKGVDLRTWMGAKLPVSPLEATIDAFLSCCAVRDRLLVVTPRGRVCRDPTAFLMVESRIAELRGRIETLWSAGEA